MYHKRDSKKQNQEFTPRGLASYLACGQFNKHIYKNLIIEIESLTFSQNTKNFEESYQEVTNDLNELFDYLKNSIYYSSGIQRYIQQELDSLRSRFKDLHEKNNEWNSIIYSAVIRGEAKTDNELIDQTKMPTYEEIKRIYQVLMN